MYRTNGLAAVGDGTIYVNAQDSYSVPDYGPTLAQLGAVAGSTGAATPLTDAQLAAEVANWNTAAMKTAGGTCVDPKTGAVVSCGPVAWLNTHSTLVMVGAAAVLGGVLLMNMGGRRR